MYKLFTLTEANRMIPLVDEKIRTIQDVMRDLNRLQYQFNAYKPLGSKALNMMQELEFLNNSAQELASELGQLGVHVTDLESGSVGFPSQLGAEVVRLCWRPGEKVIRYYQHLNDDNKHPLPAGPHASSSTIPTHALANIAASSTLPLTSYGAAIKH